MAYLLSESEYRAFRRLISRDLITGPGVSDTPAGLTIGRKPGGVERLLARGKRLWLGKITTAASGGGKYNARTFVGSSNAAATGNLAEADLGTLAGADDVLFLHLDELGVATHYLTTDSATPYAIGAILGANADGRKVVAGFAIDTEPCEE